jgi:hypothetical protein
MGDYDRLSESVRHGTVELDALILSSIAGMALDELREHVPDGGVARAIELLEHVKERLELHERRQAEQDKEQRAEQQLIYAGHRIKGEHSCWAMRCKDLGPELEEARARLDQNGRDIRELRRNQLLEREAQAELSTAEFVSAEGVQIRLQPGERAQIRIERAPFAEVKS